MAAMVDAIKQEFTLASAKANLMEYGIPAAGFVGGFMAAKWAAGQLATLGAKKASSAEANDGKPGYFAKAQWAPGAIILALSLVGASVASKKVTDPRARKAIMGAGIGAVTFAAVSIAKALAAGKSGKVAQYVQDLPFAGLGEAVGYPIGAIPLSIEALNGAPVSVEEVRRQLAGLPVTIDPARVYSTQGMARRQAATLGG